MQWYGLLFVIFLTIFTCLTINTKGSTIAHIDDNSLLPFSSIARFKPPPDTIDDDSDITKPALCRVSDINSCSKYPNTICQHFDNKIKVHLNPNKPKDKSQIMHLSNETDSDEGYCVNIHKLSEDCNPYHGDWILMKKSNKEHSYMQICQCKKPGFIGNEKLFGPCEDPFICDGKVKDINVPFDEIECKCEKNEINFKDKLENIPMCRPPTVRDVFDWNKILLPPELKDNFISKEDFDVTIRGNVNTLDKMIDPCSICPVTGKKTNAIASHGLGTVFCSPTESNFGIPIRRSSGTRLLDGAFGPDGVLAVEWREIIVFSDNVSSDPQRFLYIFGPTKRNIDFIQALRESKNVTNEDKYQVKSNEDYGIEVGPGNFLGVTILPHSTFTPKLFTYADVGSFSSTTYLYAQSVAHSGLTKNLIQSYHVNGIEGNIISTVLKIRKNYEKLTVDLTMPLVAKKVDGRNFDYITYSDEFLNDSKLRKSWKLGALCVKPLNKHELEHSNWSVHKDQSGHHYMVIFLISRG